jgi:uncharacterized Fe-S cluster-containing radical SAM superfamily protein
MSNRDLETVLHTMFDVSNDRPPNYEELAKALPGAKRKGVIFTYGKVIYNPSFVKMDHSLLAHEATHVVQQTADGMTPEEWWKMYIINPYFRYDQELEAHRIEHQVMARLGHSRIARRLALKGMARRLSGQLYGNVVSYHKAMEAIRDEGISGPAQS